MQDIIAFEKRTKIIATLGPASKDPKVIKALFDAGTNMIRLNASHYPDPKQIVEDYKLVQKVAKKQAMPIGIFVDLQGPKIRLGAFKEKATLAVGDTFILTPEEIECNGKGSYISYPGIVEDVEVGDPVFIDDGKIRLTVTKKSKTQIFCKVARGGELSSHKGVNFPVTNMKVSAFTDKDQRDVTAFKGTDIDYVALSFVSKEQDVITVRNYLDSIGLEKVKIIAKIERQQAIDNLDSIMDHSDVIMVARGDLGVEIGVSQVPQVQKKIIRKCKRRIKPVIVATQMLESMINAETATRAEVSDVANAVYDLCDAVMLSGETAMGINPPNVVSIMSNICSATEGHYRQIKKEDEIIEKFIFDQHNRVTSFCKAAEQIAEENQATAIMAFTSSGNTPLIASKLDSPFPIIAPTDEEYICRRMALYRGVVPLMLPVKFKDIHKWTDMIRLAVNEAKEFGMLKKGDVIVVTAGIPIGQTGGVNSIRIITV